MSDKEWTIFLDIWGVQGNFVKACNELFNTEEEYIIPKTHGGIAGDFGLSNKDFWEKIKEASVEFWAGAGAYPWHADLRNLCGRYGDVVFCTTPSMHPSSISGTYIWMYINAPMYTKKYVITREKYLLAKPNTILIDDYDKNIDMFRKHGGKAIVFPQPWNSKSSVLNDHPGAHINARMEYVYQQLERITSS